MRRMGEAASFKVKDVAGRSAFAAYRRMVHGDVSLAVALRNELVQAFCGDTPGALGLFLRAKLYPRMFAAAGRGCVFGRGLTLRHPHKIRLGERVVIDEHAVLDAKGEGNRGIELGNRVFVGRGSIVYCKGGDIVFEDDVNLSSNCQVFSCGSLTVKRDTVIGAFTYLLNGGEYDYRDAAPFARQSGANSRGPTVVGENNWLGARITVLDGVRTGAHCVFAAGAVVTKDVPDHSLCAGVPARILRSIAPGS
jgi:acetyltransferase-like isoleucine patch superfamily enzyme